MFFSPGTANKRSGIGGAVALLGSRPVSRPRRIVSSSKYQVTADAGDYSQSLGLGSLGLGGSGYDTSRWAPVWENPLDKTVLEQWLPESDQGMVRLNRKIYIRDEAAGPTTDLMSVMPFSDWSLSGVEDQSVLKSYEKSLEAIDLQQMMPELAVEYLSIGRVIASLIFDKESGTWSDILPQPPEDCTVTPRYVRGYEPKVDLRVSPEIRAWASSRDPRDQESQAEVPPEFLSVLRRGGVIPLNPVSTLYISRKAFPTDYLGTSYYARLLPFYIMEQVLLSGTLVSAVRRQRAILHITAGLDDKWEPDEQEREAISSLFQKADEDPVGAIVVTPQGVETNEVKQGSDLWKLSDEWDFLTTAKYRALATSEAFISADATYSNMATAMSVFVENLRNFRDILTHRIFYRKLFPVQAKANGFVRRTQADRDHRIRREPEKVHDKNDKEFKKAIQSAATDIERKAIKQARDDYHQAVEETTKTIPGYRTARGYPDRELLIPTINWIKHLQPIADRDYLDVLRTLEEQGVPIPIRQWAAAGGQDIADLMEQLERDISDRKQIKAYQDSMPKDEEGEGDGGFGGRFASLGSLDREAVKQSFIDACHQIGAKKPPMGLSGVTTDDEPVWGAASD